VFFSVRISISSAQAGFLETELAFSKPLIPLAENIGFVIFDRLFSMIFETK